eukprot:2925831-Amphidinium_carterae.1
MLRQKDGSTEGMEYGTLVWVAGAQLQSLADLQVLRSANCGARLSHLSYALVLAQSEADGMAAEADDDETEGPEDTMEPRKHGSYH